MSDDPIDKRMTDKETWNTCPRCYKTWRDLNPTPGVTEQDKICDTCYNKIVTKEYDRR